MLLDIESHKENETELLRLSGVLDISTVDALKSTADNINDVQELIIDFAKVKFIDSTGVGGIIHVIKQFQASHRKIKIINISSDVFEIFDILGLPEIFGRDLFLKSK